MSEEKKVVVEPPLALVQTQEQVEKTRLNLLRELDAAEEKWEKTGMLKGLTDPWVKKSVALLLENQRLTNDQAQDQADLGYFKRISIPLVRRIYGTNDFIAWDIVSVQPMLGPCSNVYYWWPGKALQFEEILAKTRKMKCNLCYEAQQDGHCKSALEEEAQMVAQYADEMRNEINREILTDIRNNAGTVASLQWSNVDTLWSAINTLTQTVNAKCGAFPNWFACSPEVAKVLKESATWEPRDTGESEDAFCNHTSLAVRKTGVLSGPCCNGQPIKLIEDPLFPPGGLIMGYRGESHFQSAYHYCPYVPLSITPVVLDPESFCPRRGFLHRYGKKLLVNGAKWYARLAIADFPKEEVKKPETLDSKPEEAGK